LASTLRIKITVIAIKKNLFILSISD